jgi:hypothetical protein
MNPDPSSVLLAAGPLTADPSSVLLGAGPLGADPSSVLLGAGPLGAIILAMGIWIMRLHKDLRESQENRISDAKAVTEKILTLVESHQGTQETLSLAIQGNTAAITDVKEWMQELGRELRGRKP